MRTPNSATLRRMDARRFAKQFAADVHYYLLQQPRQLPSRYLYDELGSALFEAICRMPWYPITRAEERLLVRHGSEIVRRARPTAIVELGSGSGEKLRLLLDRADVDVAPLRVHLVDLSTAALASAAVMLATLEQLHVTTHEAAYEAGLEDAARTFTATDRALILFLGSNIGNFDPPACEALLRGIRRELRVGDMLLLGADLVKPDHDLQLAYDDPLGITAAFNRNLLVRVNRELGGNFLVDQFDHHVVWNSDASRVEMHLVTRAEQAIRVTAADLEFVMSAGETIWTESSYKYREHQIASMLAAAGYETTAQWIDHDDLFALTLSEAV